MDLDGILLEENPESLRNRLLNGKGLKKGMVWAEMQMDKHKDGISAGDSESQRFWQGLVLTGSGDGHGSSRKHPTLGQRPRQGRIVVRTPYVETEPIYGSERESKESGLLVSAVRATEATRARSNGGVSRAYGKAGRDVQMGRAGDGKEAGGAWPLARALPLTERGRGPRPGGTRSNRGWFCEQQQRVGGWLELRDARGQAPGYARRRPRGKRGIGS
ncbi:hypothetical protein AXG93_1112s1190 [Marchantia polymorpha subsp. ruderalis]|uniref:Uncharacterized protein n=1 Tax=Marchantia polymorpha subsp. ruderalis TaxID=1480154 RepID=A0A176WCI6_MARPO|nr:hypothetical protein AXG93_1112s1190 [Marchantia polymorpha subsp. ruderalis]